MQLRPAASSRPAVLDAAHTTSFRAVLPVEETAQLTFALWAMSVSIISLFSISSAVCRGVMLDSFMALTWALFWAKDGENRVGPIRDGQVEPGVPVVAGHSRIHLGPVFAQNAETQDCVVLDVCQDPLDSVPRLRPRGRGDGPVQEHQVEHGEASCVSGIGIDGRLHSVHSGNGSTRRATT